MKKHFNYEISFQQLNGRMPPANTPCDKQPVVHIDSNVHVLWPNDQIYYSSKELKHLAQQDYFNHPLVSHLKPLIHRKPISYSMRRYEDPLVMEKKKEILKNLSWLSHQKNNSSELAKTLKFRLNQLSQSNYSQISRLIIDIIVQNQQGSVTFLEELINIAANQNKFRALYSQLLRELIKQTNNYQQLNNYLNCFIEFRENYEEFQNQIDKDEAIIVLNKRKQNILGKYKFIVHLYKDNTIDITFINKAIIELFNRSIYLLKNMQLQSFFVDENIEGILEIVTAMKNDLYIKQYKDDIRLEQQFIQFIQAEHRIQEWNNSTFRFSQKGIKILLIWIEKQQVSQRIKMLVANLQEKLQNNWKTQKKKQQKKREPEYSDSDREREELTISPQKSVKLQVQNLELINEEDNEYSVQKQFTLKQINQHIEKIFTLKIEEFRIEILKLYSVIKTSELITTFWSCYLKLITRLTLENCQKVEMTYSLFEATQEEFIKELILEQLQIKLAEIIYDIIDSKYGTQFITRLIQGFINQNLKHLQLIPIEINDEETQKFALTLLPQLISSAELSMKENAEVLQDYLEHKLCLTNDQQQKIWSSFK